MIKKLLITITSIIGLGLCFTNAQTLVGNSQPIGQAFGSFYNNTYEIQVNGKGNLLTTYIGEGKRLLYFQKGTYFFWSANKGLPYMSVSYYNGNTNNRNQGYVMHYYLCDYFTGTNFNIDSCTKHDINDGEFETIGARILNSLNNNGNIYYSYYDVYVRVGSTPPYGGLDICFNSPKLNIALCFYGGLTYTEQYCDTYYQNTFGKKYQYYENGCKTYPSLTGSLNIGYNFDAIEQSLLGAPLNKEQEYIPNDAQTVQICPTIGEMMKDMGNEYNTGYCYNSTLYYDGNTMQQTTKEDIFTIFQTKNNYTNRTNIYYNNCKAPATQESCKNAFSGEFKKESIIGNAINKGINTDKLRTYCDMGLNHQPNEDACQAGYANNTNSPIELLDQIIKGELNIQKPATGTIYDEILSGNNKTYDPADVRGNINSVYDKITGMFKNREGVQGIIPEIIIRMMFIIILFTVIFKW